MKIVLWSFKRKTIYAETELYHTEEKITLNLNLPPESSLKPKNILPGRVWQKVYPMLICIFIPIFKYFNFFN